MYCVATTVNGNSPMCFLVFLPFRLNSYYLHKNYFISWFLYRHFIKKCKLSVLSFMKVMQHRHSVVKEHNKGEMRNERMKRDMIEHNNGFKRAVIGLRILL